jgi:DNA-binding LacI/PurR family transcriptional regulator
MRKQGAAVGLRDIAEMTGVSLTTVSKILGGKDKLFADATVARIRQAAQQLNYRPNAIASNLRCGRTRTVGAMIPLIGYFSHVLSGIHSTLFEHGYAVIIGTPPKLNTASDDQTEAQVIHQLIERNVDGIILRPSSEQFERAYFDEIWQRNVPLIAIDRELSLFKTDFVGTDDEAIGAAAARHLADLGHRRLLFIGRDDVQTAELRGLGFRCAAGEVEGASCAHFVGAGQWQEVASVMQRDDRPTGIFCYSDAVAERLITRLQEWGVRVPEDVSVIGAGNTKMVRELTTFDQQPYEIGKGAAQLYLKRINEDTRAASPTIIRLPAILIPRATTAPPPA